MKVLVGYTGFVGSNLCMSTKFDALYNSKNIEEAYGTNPDLLIYAGVRAEKYLANNNAQKDYNSILQAEDNIKKINPKKLVLISTIDVIDNPIDFYEDDLINEELLQPYGYNRYQLEKWCRKEFKDCLIVRLPALFGKGIKKNFIYDLINIVPSMIKKDKMKELFLQNSEILNYYSLQENDFYKLNSIGNEEKQELIRICKELDFTALNFTDSRNIYQFYNLENLWRDINIALENDIQLLHLATEPISVSIMYEYLYEKIFMNEFLETPIQYNFKTIYGHIYNKKDDYLANKNEVLERIRAFINEQLY